MSDLLPAVRTVEERNRLVEQWAGLVPWSVRRLRHLRAVRLCEDDARSAAGLALIRAAELWREDGGASFRTFAAKCIRMQILRAAFGGQLPPLTFADVEADPSNPLDPAAPEEPDPLDAKDVRAQAEQLLGVLPKPWAKVLRLRFGIGGPTHTLREIADRYHVSPERIRQVQGFALKRLQRHVRRHRRPLAVS